MLSVRNGVKTKRLGMRLSIAVGARRRSHGGLTLIDASGLRLAALEQIVTSVPQRPENRDWRDRPKPITDDTLQCGAEEKVGNSREYTPRVRASA